jgi:phosphotransferase system enzyme I (PtsP)
MEGAAIAIDGYQGQVFMRPTASILCEFQRLIAAEQELAAGLETLRQLPAETLDGAKVPLYANSGLVSDIRTALERGAEGIGLYRSEFTFMLYESFPSEDEQYRIYHQVLEAFAPKPVIMRTLDIGGDKGLAYFPVAEDNALLGWRGIRVCLDHPEIFLTQLRAMLRADVDLHNLRLLLPMISSPAEVDQARFLLNRACCELRQEGYAVTQPPLGVMLEVPAAIYQMASLAQRVDFFSIGTNDLTQYLLAVNRNNARVATLWDCLHPAVIRAVYAAVQEGHRYAKPVGVCGEMAGDPLTAILLLGMGSDTLSMVPPSLSRIKWVIRSFSHDYASKLLSEVLSMEDAREVRALLNKALQQVGLGALIRNGK